VAGWCREDPDEPLEGPAWQAGVGVEGHHEADPAQALVLASVQRERRRGIAPQQAVEVFELPALALPGHPAPLRGVVKPRAVEHVEGARVFACIAPIESRHAADQRIDDDVVPGHVLSGCIMKVREEDELDFSFGVAQVVSSELLE